jgi:hypothetical protein
MAVLPNFLIVGAPKAGTTSLYYYLKGHPEVFMCSPKEPNFFSCVEIKKQKLYYEEVGIETIENYRRLFKGVRHEKAIGEASVSYLFYPDTPLKIKQLIPDAKIIILLRNPIQRAFSHYLMDRRLGYVSLAFDDIIYKRKEHPLLHLYYQQYIELGLYYEQVKRYMDMFGQSQVKIYLTANLKSDLEGVIRNLCDFLGIDRSFPFDLSEHYNVFEEPRSKLTSLLYTSSRLRWIFSLLMPEQAGRLLKSKLFFHGDKPELDKETKNQLAMIFRNDIEKLEGLLNQDLSNWYAEP